MQLGLGRAAGARIHRDHAGGDGRPHEERQADRDLEAGPDVVRELQVVEPQGPVADRPVVALRLRASPSTPRTSRRSGARRGAGGGDGPPGCVVPHRSHRSALTAPVRRRRRRRGARAGLLRQAAQTGDHLCSPSRAATASPICATLDAGLARSVPAHAARATFTWPCSCSSGTGSSWRRSPSSERPARGRKKARWQCRQVSVPDCQLAVVDRAAAAGADVAVGEQRPVDVCDQQRDSADGDRDDRALVELADRPNLEP